MAAERVIYIVVDVDEVPVRAFTEPLYAETYVQAHPDLHVVAVPVGPVEGSDGS